MRNVCCLPILALLGMLAPSVLAQEQKAQAATAAAQQQEPDSNLPHGKKLMMKDGTFQIVRSYQVQGDRVRYFSIERAEWEEIPAALVDWDATKKAEAVEAAQENALTEKIKADAAAAKTMPLDVDASLEILPGVLLPPGEGLFALDGNAILTLKQNEATSKLNKGHMVERVLIPIPVIPIRHSIELSGTRADIRIKSSTPEFYFRTGDSGEPEVELLHAKVKDGRRQVENIDTLFGQQQERANNVSMQEWEVAKGVYRFTLSQSLDPGEYAVTEISSTEGASLLLWDFGVDAPPHKSSKKKK